MRNKGKNLEIGEQLTAFEAALERAKAHISKLEGELKDSKSKQNWICYNIHKLKQELKQK